MIALDPIGGRDAPEYRTIVYCDPYNGKLYDLSVTSFVVLQTMRLLSETDDLDPMSPVDVSAHTADVAEMLVAEGWFTDEEYVSNVARDEAEGVDEELKDLLG